MANPASGPGSDQRPSQPYDPTTLPSSAWGYIDPSTPAGQQAHQNYLNQMSTLGLAPGSTVGTNNVSNGSYVGGTGGQPLQGITPAQLAAAQAIAGATGSPQAAAASAAAQYATGNAPYTVLGGSSGPGSYTAGGGSPPSSNILGQVGGYTTGMTPVFSPNDLAITGNPVVGASGDYGLNGIWNNLQSITQNLAPQNYQTSAAQLGAAPQSVASYGTGATGTAAQGSAAQGAAALGGPSSYGAALGNAMTGNASNANAALGTGPAYGVAAQGGPSFMGAAQGGYALGGPNGISTAGDAAWQSQQQQLANQLGLTASGGGVSPADLQLRQGMDQQVAANLAVLGSQRGNVGNAALAQRSAGDQAAQAEQQLNANMGIQRAQETLNAQNALGSVLGTGRGQAQNYNLNQAQLAQQMGLANLGNAQSALMQNTAFQQQGNQFNASQAQQAMLANLAAQNQQLGQNVGNIQGLNLANLGNAQQAGLFNAGQNQAMTLANMGAANQMTGLNLGALNSANAGNAQLAQQMGLANLGAQNAMTSQNSQQAQAAMLANLTAQNQFGLNNVNNAQQMNLANLSNAQQTALANQAMLGQYGLQQGSMNQQTALANQQAAITSNQQYYQQLMAALGSQAGIAAGNQAAAAADVQMRQNAALTQYGIDNQVAVSNAQAGANLLGAGMGAGATVLGAMIAASDENLKFGITGGNPMMASFLEQYQASRSRNPGASPDKMANGLDVFNNMSRANQGAQGGGLGGYLSSAGTSLSNAIRALAANNKAASAAYGDAASANASTNATDAMNAGMPGSFDTGALAQRNLGGLDFGAGAGGSPPPPGIASSEDMLNQLQGGIGFGTGQVPYTPVSESFGPSLQGELDPSVIEATSDDQAKENVISGNRGMQQFLSQANAQQNAQNQQGATNNAFMQTGQAPSAQVDRQLPPMPDANAGYGQAQGIYGPMFGGPQQSGYALAGGVNQNAMFGGAGGINGGGATQGSTNYGGVGASGGYAPGSIDTMGGVSNGGGISQGPTMALGGILPGWVNSGTSGSSAPAVTPHGAFALPGAGTAANDALTTLVNSGATAMQPANTAVSNSIGGVPMTAGTAPISGINPAAQTGNVPIANIPPMAVPTAGTAANSGTAATIRNVGGYMPALNLNFATTPALPAAGTAANDALTTMLASGATGISPSAGSSGSGSAPVFSGGTHFVSDEKAKKDIKDDTQAIRTMLEQVQPASQRMDFGQQANVEDAMYGADPNESPSSGYVPMYQGQGWNRLPGPSDYNYEHTPSPLNIQAASEGPGAPNVEAIKAMLDQLHAHQYRYKDPTAPGAGPGTYVSPMAQELEKTDLGKNFVHTGPDGYKRVDYGHMAGTMLAGQAMLHERLGNVEKMLAQLRSRES